MANWQHTLDLKDLWRQYNKEKLTPQELGKAVAGRIRKLSLPKDYEKEAEEIASAFELEIENVEDFDRILNDLYDLADTPLPTPKNEWMPRKLIWVATQF